MASQGPPSSSLPSSMGPGARPVQQGESPGGGIAEIMQIRNKYSIQVEPETLKLGYELKGIPRTYRLAFESIPMGNLKRKWLFGGPRRAQISGITVIDFIRGTENLAGRPLTQTEAEAIAFYSTNRTIYSLWGNLTGCVAGGLMAWRTYDKMKFPFRSPRPMEEYQSFPTKRWALATGKQAQFMWQFTRFNVWAALAVFAASPLFAAAGNTFGMYGLYKDERTKGLMMEIKGSLDRIAANRYRGPDQRQNPRPPTQGQTQDGQYGNQDPQGFYRDPGRTDYSGGDQYSGDSSFTDGTTDTGVMGDAPAQAPEARQSTSSRWGNRSGAPREHETQYTRAKSDGFYDSQSPSSSGSPFFDDDDASPTAGNDPDMSTPGPASKGFPGSWARIRRENQRTSYSNPNPFSGQSKPDQGFQGQQQQQQQQQHQPDPQSHWQRDTSRSTGVVNSENSFSQSPSEQREGGDGFSFSNSEADRQLAREQAQKEFDAMLDKERRASGSDEYDRGMRAVQSGEEGAAATSGMSAWERRRRG
ncbi:hypothetical protein PV08_09127 [Exophiala spinifera]|uniref:Uncharacterized protein n=1 Tax=Exophiala spinifera TaxID=91928 RepID=A0A0D2BKS7_9EURO|nr:uncharacterized protein PV08_09127 [Exophiala spinifera]KIW11854.1 hypothetical protein PV08_09127 [Exophiala spinifera]